MYTNKDEKLKYYLSLACKSKILFWAEQKLKWVPKFKGDRVAWYQIILAGCFDGIYLYPNDYYKTELRGKPINKFAWRVGRQAGKSECLALGALYLAICKPIKEPHVRYFQNNKLITLDNPTGRGKEIWYSTRGAKIIVASADADKAKILYDRVKLLVSKSPEYSAMLDIGVIDEKLHPYQKFTFNAEGWTEPSSIVFRGPGSKGQALRGQTYDYKLYDEVDYMPQAFFEAELATTLNAGESAITIVSSTPSGKREHFFYACFEAGTPVLMSDGTLKNIEDIRIGEEVVNRYGNAEKVTDIMQRPYNWYITHFTTTLNNVVIKSTSTHKFMAIRKVDRFCKACSSMVWKNKSVCPVLGYHTGLGKLAPKYEEIGKLTLGDYLVIPKNRMKNRKMIGHHVIQGEFIYVPINAMLKRLVKTEVYNLTVGEDHSYCVNYYGVANCTDPKKDYEEFHFPSYENPSYDDKMEAEFRAGYTQTVYEHEILADWGTVDYGVFDWTYFERVFGYKYENNEKQSKLNIPGEYTCIKLNSDDINRIRHYNLGKYLKQRIPERDNRCKYYFGADLGYTSDPSEFVIFEQFNGVMKLILRIHMEHLTYDIQADMIALLDTHFLFESLGMDKGNAGQAVADILRSSISDVTGYNKYASHRFQTRLVAMQFGEKITLGKINGEKQILPVKEWMTNLIIKQAEEGLLIMPGLDYDDEVENQFRNHTYSIASSGAIIYSKSSVYPEHIIDAARCAFLARGVTMLPKKRNWAVGSTFKSRGSGGWR